MLKIKFLLYVAKILLKILGRIKTMASREELNSKIGEVSADVESAVKEVTDAFVRLEGAADFQPEIDKLSALHTSLGGLIEVAKGKGV